VRRQTFTVVLSGLMALGSPCLAMAEEAKKPDDKKQTTNSIGMKLTLVPAGEFMMGSHESTEDTIAFFKKTIDSDLLTPDVFEDEHPQHRVRITRPFYLGTYHVTRGQFRQFIADTGYKTTAETADEPKPLGWDSKRKTFTRSKEFSWRNTGFDQTDDHPVVNVSWHDAVAFCKWLSKKEGKSYRLPTEAEWEYACRAGTTTRYFSGNDPETLAKVANVSDAAGKAMFPGWKGAIKANDGYAFTSPVGSFQPNAFGLYDMHGNAYHWCSDRHSDDYYAMSPRDDPKGPDTGDANVLRGGSWVCVLYGVRSCARNWRLPGDYYFDRGFRVAASFSP
jgi:formylglycine-generating enzyme